MRTEIVVLDAMGVIYSVGDDVRDLLYPFIIEEGGVEDANRIKEVYISASLGRITSSEFWKLVGLSPALEDEYLRRHKLTNGLNEFLKAINSKGLEAWCLSNDISEWSRKLRTRFSLENYFRGFVISGDIGFRKPDPAIYKCLLEKVGASASDIIFVDDNPKNLDAAAKLGLRTVLFDTEGSNPSPSAHEVANNFEALLRRLS